MSKKNKKTIKLDAEQLFSMCTEHGYVPTGRVEWEQWECVEDMHDGGSRHTEFFSIVLKAPNGEFYTTQYETSQKDSMGWDECNEHHDGLLHQVFPKEIVTTIYE